MFTVDVHVVVALFLSRYTWTSRTTSELALILNVPNTTALPSGPW
jgi:hypothetical protein